jgi:hypothetical protein
MGAAERATESLTDEESAKHCTSRPHRRAREMLAGKGMLRQLLGLTGTDPTGS